MMAKTARKKKSKQEQISEELKKMGYSIDKKTIFMDHVIDTLGTHKVEARVHKRVTIILNVVVC